MLQYTMGVISLSTVSRVPDVYLAGKYAMTLLPGVVSPVAPSLRRKKIYIYMVE